MLVGAGDAFLQRLVTALAALVFGLLGAQFGADLLLRRALINALLHGRLQFVAIELAVALGLVQVQARLALVQANP
ncbi:hypothetical protein D3C81_1700470 [compost metagenome]